MDNNELLAGLILGFMVGMGVANCIWFYWALDKQAKRELKNGR